MVYVYSCLWLGGLESGLLRCVRVESLFLGQS